MIRASWDRGYGCKKRHGKCRLIEQTAGYLQNNGRPRIFVLHASWNSDYAAPGAKETAFWTTAHVVPDNSAGQVLALRARVAEEDPEARGRRAQELKERGNELFRQAQCGPFRNPTPV